MKKLILLLTATIFVACEDNGMSAPTEVCYDKKIGYKEVSTNYTQYSDEWKEGACSVKYGSDCAMWDVYYTITVRDCAENVEFH